MMVEKNNNPKEPKVKRKFSRWAIVSSVCIVVGLVFNLAACNFEMTFLWGTFHYLSGIFQTIGVISGIIGIITILRNKEQIRGLILSLAGILICGFFLFFYVYAWAIGRGVVYARQVSACEFHLRQIYKPLLTYAQNNNGKYPIPGQWCDLLIGSNQTGNQMMLWHLCCGITRISIKKGKCRYAINPAAEVHSPNDVVLLFETKDGWNQYGTAELLTFNNHKGKGCHILFNDGKVVFINPEDVNGLNWAGK